MDGVFNNPSVEQALKNLSPEERKRYETIGKEMYDSIEFEAESEQNPMEATEALLYITEGLKSGLHPSHMDEDEKNYMSEIFGESWYKQYGYVKEDLTQIHTLNPKPKKN